MKSTDIQPKNHLLTIELSSEIYAALLAEVRLTGKTEADIVTQGLREALGIVVHKDQDQDRFALLELKLENKLKQYVDELIKDRLALPELLEHSSQNNLGADTDFKKSMPIPTIRPLQIGDRVLILEPDSPYYMAKLIVIKTSLIRATVETETGEQTFLKRDLRFVEATSIE